MTLIELVLSISVATVLMGGMASAVFIATRAVDTDTPTAETMRAANVLGRITEDLKYAKSFSERAAHSVTFTVPDRDTDPDDNRDALRYAWSGTAGDPLVYEYNSTSATLVENVHDFNLVYLLTILGPPVPVGAESAETLLIAHNPQNSADLQDYAVDGTQWCAQCFYPALPANATGWRITGVEFVAKKSGLADGSNLVQIRPAGPTAVPTGTVLGQVVIDENLLPTTRFWHEVSFTDLSRMDPATGLCLVIAGDGPPSSEVLYESGAGPLTPDTHFATTSDEGETWSPSSDLEDMIFKVYGTVTTID